jgi:Ca-activated chloride channel family protein
MTGRMSLGARPVKVFTTVPMIADVSGRTVSGNVVQADLGSLDGRKGQAVLIEARVPAHKAGAYRVGQVEIRYDVPSGGFSGQTVKADLNVTFTDDKAAAAKVNAEVMNLVEKVTAFKLQTQALTEADAGNIVAATRKFQAAATVLLNLGEDDLADAVEREIAALKKTGSLTAAGTKKLEYGTRKLTQALTTAMK